jgi:hypothetical protein
MGHSLALVRAGQEVTTLARLAYSGTIVSIIVQSQFPTFMQKKRRGPRPTGKGEPVQVRLQPGQMSVLDAWILKQPEPQPSRPEAIRRLIEQALAAEPKKRRP